QARRHTLARCVDVSRRAEGRHLRKVHAAQAREAPVLVLAGRHRRSLERRGSLLAKPCQSGDVSRHGSCRRPPPLPSICSWISLFISIAYSSGSSFVIGSMKPLTIMAFACSSVSPRERR